MPFAARLFISTLGTEVSYLRAHGIMSNAGR